MGCVGAVRGTFGGGDDAAQDSSRPFFLTRGVVLAVKDIETYDWPALAKAAGLTTLATHIKPSEIAAFVKTDAGQKFLGECRRQGLEVEHELHALGDLLPRELYDQDKHLFRMDEQGQRVRDYNLCVHAQPALDVVAEKAAHYTRLLPSTTGRYFYWIDDAMPMCRCPKCRVYSDSDQALIFANHLMRAIRAVDPRARLAHLAYANTLEPPTQVRPSPGVFLEFAPLERRMSQPEKPLPASGPNRHGRPHNVRRRTLRRHTPGDIGLERAVLGWFGHHRRRVGRTVLSCRSTGHGLRDRRRSRPAAPGNFSVALLDEGSAPFRLRLRRPNAGGVAPYG